MAHDTKAVTIAEVLDAMEADKTPKAREVYNGTDGSRCAIGGAAALLGVTPTPIYFALGDIPLVRSKFDNARDFVTLQNDRTRLKKATIAKRLRARLTPEQLAMTVS